MPEFVLKIKGLNKLRSNFKKAPEFTFKELTKAVNKSAWKVTQAIQQETPVKTGALKGSIRPAFGKLRAVIQPHKKYAIFVHESTKPHIIRPKTKKALWWKGALHPVRKVMHPGTKGKPFMEIGLKNSVKDVEDIFNKHVNNILNKISKI